MQKVKAAIIMFFAMGFLSFILSASLALGLGFLGSCASKKGSSPERAEAHLQIGMGLFGEGRYPESLRELNQANALKPADPRIEMGIGLVYFQQGQLNEAQKWMSQACERAPNFAECWNNLSSLSIAQKKYKEAVTYARKALSLSTYMTPELAHANLARAYSGMRDNYRAKQSAKKALSLVPEDCELRLLLARLQLRDGAFEDALTELSGAVRLCPTRPDLQAWESYTYFKLGQRSRARQGFEQIIERFPQSAADDYSRKALFNLEQEVPVAEPNL